MKLLVVLKPHGAVAYGLSPPQFPRLQVALGPQTFTPGSPAGRWSSTTVVAPNPIAGVWAARAAGVVLPGSTARARASGVSRASERRLIICYHHEGWDR